MTTAVMLASYLVATIGVPVPARVHKPGDTPFPCQHHACGCLSAEQCREHCCCYTASQRLAWTRQYGIEATTALVAEAAAETQHCDHASADGRAAPRGCCADRVAEIDHGDEHQAERQATTNCCQSEESTTEAHLIFSMTASKCRPISSLWCVIGAVLVPPAVSWQFQWNVVERISPMAASPPWQDLSPPVPPPRV